MKSSSVGTKISKHAHPTDASSSSSPRIALACDWLTTPGGAEKVLLELHHMYPDAPIYTSQYSKKGINWFDDADVRTGWLQFFPKSFRKILGPLRQIYFSHLGLSDYDLVISVTGAEAKAIRTKKHPAKSTKNHSSLYPHYSTDGDKSQDAGARHLCYCHVPTQYYWQMYDKYVENPGFGVLNPLVRLVFKLLVKPLRQADYKSAQLPDQFITISEYAREQIQQYYHRDAVIVAPPVEIAKFTPSSFNSDFHKVLHNDIHSFSTKTAQNSTTSVQFSHSFSTKNPQKSSSNPQDIHNNSTKTQDFSTENSKKSTISPQVKPFIIACRQVTWKRIDLAIQACLQARQPLLVVGDGPEHASLLKLAEGSHLIKFIPWAQTVELAGYLQGARGYIFPSLEPFGIAAVEALAAGCPVIAYAEGGSRDFIQDGQNGLLFHEQTVDSLVRALHKFDTLSFDRAEVSQSAAKFSQSAFRKGIKQQVSQYLQSPHQQQDPTAHPRSPHSATQHSPERSKNL